MSSGATTRAMKTADSTMSPMSALMELQRAAAAPAATSDGAAGGLFDLARLRARLDGQRDLSDEEKQNVMAIAGAVGSPLHKPVMDLLLEHEGQIRERVRRQVIADQAKEVRQRAQAVEARRAAWRRCPRFTAMMCVIASEHLPDRLSPRERDAYVQPQSVVRLVEAFWELTRMSDEELRALEPPRLFDAHMAPDEEA